MCNGGDHDAITPLDCDDLDAPILSFLRLLAHRYLYLTGGCLPYSARYMSVVFGTPSYAGRFITVGLPRYTAVFPCTCRYKRGTPGSKSAELAVVKVHFGNYQLRTEEATSKSDYQRDSLFPPSASRASLCSLFCHQQLIGRNRSTGCLWASEARSSLFQKARRAN